MPTCISVADLDWAKAPEFAAVATKASAKKFFHVCVLCSLL
jgi:hypothetical protein